ncbi:hypothetical protein [Bailinhaonella thermotolerans]|uniref:Uncharacterized protein n=1 Tax=Bailinhaonella thermotolerans TaxID=1070861 RepID=A0A3A3ZZU0_9ACTN|nr:hypothetical protein [Bailinhaonella thermotolerans]RJL19743.1 hypothetical protein D5H75_40160 [Bailinhaonella thermotolerans]
MKPPERLQLDTDRDPWDRQSGESDALYAHFRTYLELGPGRTVRKTAETRALTAPYLRGVAAAMRWRERADAYDAEARELYRAELEARARDAARADAELLDKVAERLGESLDWLDARHLKPADLVRLLDVVMRHRRALYGGAGVEVTVSGPGGGPVQLDATGDDLAALSPEQRRRRIAETVEAVQRALAAASGADDDD